MALRRPQLFLAAGQLGADWLPARGEAARPRPAAMFGSAQSLRDAQSFADQRLVDALAGQRVRVMSDSFGEALRGYFRDMFNCSKWDIMHCYPGPSPPLEIIWRFTRLVRRNDGDFDGFFTRLLGTFGSTGNRTSRPTEWNCTNYLNFREFNVTVIGMTTWPLVYSRDTLIVETLTALRRMLLHCRAHYSDYLLRHHVVLWQDVTASHRVALVSNGVCASRVCLNNSNNAGPCVGERSVETSAQLQNQVLQRHGAVRRRRRRRLAVSASVHHSDGACNACAR
jgi:hypothetical protein